MNSFAGEIKSTCTTCPYCGVGCGIKVTQQLDGITVTGDKEHPANFGRLCSKGYALGDTLGYENRLLSPRINNDEVPWDVATDRIAAQFQSVRDEFGPEAIGFYVSGQLLTEDYYVVNKFVKGYLGTANIDTNSRLCMASSVAGHKRAFGSDTVPGCYADLDSAELVVLVGSNLAWCHPVLFQRIERAREVRNNLTVVVIDPRKTATAQLADLHLDINSGDGNDAVLFTGLLSYLSKTDTLDYQWINEHTSNFDEVYESSIAWNPSLVSAKIDVSVEKISAFYRLFQNTKKVVTIYSQGVNQSVCGTDTVNSIINCHLATGRIGKKGCGPFSITGQPNAMGGREVGGLANMLACHMDIDNESHRSIVQRYWNSPGVAKTSGLKAVELFDAVKSGKIKALWVMATNPVDSMPAANTVAQAIADCPFVVVSDITQATDTSKLATVQLPAQAWSEKNGTVTNSERRISRQRQFRTSPPNARPDWWAVAEVAKKMGFKQGFNFNNAGEIFREYAGLSAFENEGSRDFDIGAYSHVSDDDYDSMQPFQWPQRIHRDEDSTRLFTDGHFNTADGKARFVKVNTTTHAPSLREYDSTDSSISLVLNTGRIRDQWHTMTRTGYIPKLSAHIGEPFIEINPDDAIQLEVGEGALIDVANEWGVITVRAWITSTISRGSVFIPIHWTNVFSSNARVNVLMEPKTDPVSGQPSFKNQCVNVSLSKTRAYGFMLSRHKPVLLDSFDYWSISPVENGWKTEFASSKHANELVDILREHYQDTLTGAQMVTCDDGVQLKFNTCWFSQSELVQAVYLSYEPVWVPRQAVLSYLTDRIDTTAARLIAVSGAGYPNREDPGAIVCSCMSVGRNIINSTIANGARTVEFVGTACGAGTQCGSCRSEIAKLIVSRAGIDSADAKVRRDDNMLMKNERVVVSS